MFKKNPASGRINTVPNKGSQQAMLPNRAAVNKLLKGNPSERSVQNYAKLTPMGRSTQTYQEIIDMAAKIGG